MQVNIREAKSKLSGLLIRVQGGDEITIARAGKPVARLVPIRQHLKKRIAGLAKNKIIVIDNFDAPLPAQIQTDFEW